jgi:uncharacterized protein (TIGR02466 family)
MPTIDALFATKIYRAELLDAGRHDINAEIDASCRSIAEDDHAGQAWCRRNGYLGYTSYASLDDLPWRFPVFARLVKLIDRHVAACARDLEFDLKRTKLTLDSLWINVLPPGGLHTSHIHPHSVVSGAY